MVDDNPLLSSPQPLPDFITMAAKRRISTNGTMSNGVALDLESGNGKSTNGVRTTSYGADSNSSPPPPSFFGSLRMGGGGGGGGDGGSGGAVIAKRRRALAYVGLLLLMLILSAILDMRRAAAKAGRDRKAKMQLQISTAGVGAGDGTEREHETHETQNEPKIVKKGSRADPEARGVVGINAHEGAVPVAHPGEENGTSSVGIAGELSGTSQEEREEKRGKISEQELKDDVDQLIAHVDKEQEEEEQVSNVQGNSTVVEDPKSVSESTSGSPGAVVPGEGAVINNGSTPVASNETTTTSSTEAETVEDAFAKSEARIRTWVSTEATRKMIDGHSLRYLQALALQATRGDCEQAPAEHGGSLFKTDAEAASNDDIERTDPLWGAWCIFKGRYKTDAMRDYVRKEKILSLRVEVVVNRTMVDGKVIEDDHAVGIAGYDSSTSQGVADAIKTTSSTAQTPVQELADFFEDAGAAQLTEEIAELAPHLDENEVRYLSALGMQATHGDCTNFEEREWKETIFGTKTEKQRGALWGAWCVWRGRPRRIAVDQLKRRVELLLLEKKKIDRKEASEDVTVRENEETKKESESDVGEVVRMITD